jgi:hypothetical protein
VARLGAGGAGSMLKPPIMSKRDQRRSGSGRLAVVLAPLLGAGEGCSVWVLGVLPMVVDSVGGRAAREARRRKSICQNVVPDHEKVCECEGEGEGEVQCNVCRLIMVGSLGHLYTCL